MRLANPKSITVSELHTDWSGDFFSFSLKRWLFSKIDMVTRGRERKRDEYFSDYQGVQEPKMKTTSDFAVVEVDLLCAGYDEKSGPKLFYIDYLSAMGDVKRAAHGCKACCSTICKYLL